VPTGPPTLRLPWHIRNNRSLRTCTSYLSSESKAKELLTKDILDGKVTEKMTPTVYAMRDEYKKQNNTTDGREGATFELVDDSLANSYL